MSEFEPEGDQPQAIEELVKGVRAHERDQVLLGVTGSGKTFTMAKVIEATQRPALILAPNKTLAAQLYGEFKSFFPDNAVEYFVSYYDYYQPEAYVPRTDTYIEKESDINEQIDRMRHSATRALLERDDVIIVASVSCIYGIGSVETYTAMTFSLKLGDKVDQRQLVKDLVALQYKRVQAGDFSRGLFRVRGDTIEMFPAHYEDRAWRIGFFGDEIESIVEFDPLTGVKTQDLEFVKIYANSHYVTPRPTLLQSIEAMKLELKAAAGPAQRAGPPAGSAAARAAHDVRSRNAGGDRLLRRHRELFALSHRPQARRAAADPVRISARQRARLHRREPCDDPADRRHVSRRLPAQGDAGRIRLPPAVVHGQSAAPVRGMGGDAAADRPCLGDAGPMGNGADGGVFVEQVIRPTGLIDPPVEIRPARSQVDDLLSEVKEVARRGYRTLVTVLTKRMAEDLTEYLHENGVRVRYMHSDIDTIERIEIIRDLRLGAFDALVGINLLREGLDIPECALRRHPRRRQGRLPALRDFARADDRPRRAQRRRQGRALRRCGHRLDHARDGGDQSPPRRSRQAYNEANGITPASIRRGIQDILGSVYEADHVTVDIGLADAPAIGHNLQATIADLEKRMKEAAGNLEFEEAARLRDEIKRLQSVALAVGDDPLARQDGDRGDGRRLCRRAPVRPRRQPALNKAPQTHRRRHGPAQLGRRRSAARRAGKMRGGGGGEPFLSPGESGRREYDAP